MFGNGLEKAEPERNGESSNILACQLTRIEVVSHSSIREATNESELAASKVLLKAKSIAVTIRTLETDGDGISLSVTPCQSCLSEEVWRVHRGFCSQGISRDLEGSGSKVLTKGKIRNSVPSAISIRFLRPPVTLAVTY